MSNWTIENLSRIQVIWCNQVCFSSSTFQLISTETVIIKDYSCMKSLHSALNLLGSGTKQNQILQD